VSLQFFCGLPGFLFELLISHPVYSCLGSLLSSIRRTCPSQLCLRPDPLVITDFVLSMRYPCHGTCDVRLLASSFVQLLVATILHRITLWTSLTTHNLTLSVVLTCLFFHTDFNLPNTPLALPILVWQSLSRLLSLVT